MVLQDVLDLIRRADGRPLSVALVAGQLGLAPDVAQHMLHVLVQRGRVVQVENGCRGCEVCPLHRFCAGASVVDIDRAASDGYCIRV